MPAQAQERDQADGAGQERPRSQEPFRRAHIGARERNIGEKSRDVKDTSLRMPHGERGKVVDVKVFTREENSDLSAGVEVEIKS